MDEVGRMFVFEIVAVDRGSAVWTAEFQRYSPPNATDSGP